MRRMTNREWIDVLNNDDLADWISKLIDGECGRCPAHDHCMKTFEIVGGIEKMPSCETLISEWLSGEC